MTKFEIIFLSNLTRDELRRIASLLGIKYSPMTKPEMLNAIMASEHLTFSFTGKASVHGATAVMKPILSDILINED